VNTYIISKHPLDDVIATHILQGLTRATFNSAIDSNISDGFTKIRIIGG